MLTGELMGTANYSKLSEINCMTECTVGFSSLGHLGRCWSKDEYYYTFSFPRKGNVNEIWLPSFIFRWEKNCYGGLVKQQLLHCGIFMHLSVFLSPWFCLHTARGLPKKNSSKWPNEEIFVSVLFLFPLTWSIRPSGYLGAQRTFAFDSKRQYPSRVNLETVKVCKHVPTHIRSYSYIPYHRTAVFTLKEKPIT